MLKITNYRKPFPQLLRAVFPIDSPMKAKLNKATILLTCLAALFLVGCGKSPRNAAQSFLENLSQGKITEAKKHATEPTGNLLEMASRMGAMPLDPNFRFVFVEESIDQNKAVVSFREGQDGPVQTMDLVKIDGEWKVHIQVAPAGK